MYSSITRMSGRGREAYTPHSRQMQKQPAERLRLVQLLICLAMFLAVFVGKGVFPEGLAHVGDEMLALISVDTDFRAAFSRMGESLAGMEGLSQSLEVLCGGSDSEEETPRSSLPRLTRLITKESKFFSQEPNQEALAGHYFSPTGGMDTEFLFQMRASEGADQVLPEEEVEAAEKEAVKPQEAVTAVGTILQVSDYRGQPLPDKHTMDHLSLGELETVTPVLGHINSQYGYRDHPINGKYQFHSGLDIGGQYGDPILAFATGTVEYVGEDSSYGLYLQLDHGDGIKSFYAHCKSICVSKGQQVTMGEKIGEVGSSGSATGPHLHLELKCGGLRVNPAYYVEALDQ